MSNTPTSRGSHNTRCNNINKPTHVVWCCCYKWYDNRMFCNFFIVDISNQRCFHMYHYAT